MAGTINYSASPTSTTSQLDYPQAPPLEFQIKNELSHATLVDPAKTKQTLLFCHVCDYPMAVRVALDPCNHILCYSCYASRPNECKLCDEDINSINRIPDNERILLVEDQMGYPIYKPNAMEETK